jgi:DNA-binding NarL/FixJ family response regulator
MCLNKAIGEKTTKSELTVRERELLQLAANGFSNKQIAGIVNLSIDTIDTHNRTITKSLSAKNMKEAIAIGIRKGIIE